MEIEKWISEYYELMSEVILFETSTDIAEATTCKVRRPLMVINTTR